MSDEIMRDEQMTDAQAFGFLSETDTTIEQEAAIRHLRARLRGEAAQLTCYSCGAVFTYTDLSDSDGDCPACGVEIELSAAPAAPACPNDDTGAAQLHRHNVFVYEVDFGDEGKGQYVRLADFNRVAELVPASAPAPVAGDVPRMLILGRAYTTRGGAVVKMVSIHNAGTDHETMACAEGVHRYTRRLDPLNFGRVTGTNGTDPRDLIPPTPIAALAQDRASPAGKRVPTGPRFTNSGDSEAQFIADGDRLNCPTCGGSGHADDASQAGAAGGVPKWPVTMKSEGSCRDVTQQVLHWRGIPVYVTGRVWTHDANWPLIDSAPTQAAEREVRNG